MCKCHPDIALSAKQENALEDLRRWTAKHGSENLSHRLTHGDVEANSVYNACNYHFKKLRVPGLETLSNLRTACHVAEVEYEPGMLRSTSLEEDFAEMFKYYDAGEPLHDAAFKARHSRLFSRLKSRVGRRGWLTVFTEAKKLRSNLEFRRFFAHAPENVFVDGNEVVVLDTKEDIERFAERILLAWSAEGGEMTPTAIGGIRGGHEMGRLWERLRHHAEVDLYAVLKRITGVPWVKRDGGFAPLHEIEGEHPLLRSGAEAVVDAVLAEVVPGYRRRHRHEVSIAEVFPAVTFEGSPYTGKKQPRVDIVFDRIAIEVSYYSEFLHENYNRRTEWKLAQAAAGGFKTLWLHYEDGPNNNAQKLAETFLIPVATSVEAWRKIVKAKQGHVAQR